MVEQICCEREISQFVVVKLHTTVIDGEVRDLVIFPILCSLDKWRSPTTYVLKMTVLSVGLFGMTVQCEWWYLYQNISCRRLMRIS